MQEFELMRLHSQSEALVLTLLDRLRNLRAAKPMTWDVHPDYLRLRRVYEKAEARSLRRRDRFLALFRD